MRERLKTVQTMVAKAVLHPLLPHDAKAAIAEASNLLADLVDAEQKATLRRQRMARLLIPLLQQQGITDETLSDHCPAHLTDAARALMNELHQEAL